MADACLRECLGRTCGSLRYPPAGVAPLQCSSLAHLGCDCSGCCAAENASLHAPCEWEGTRCAFVCGLRDIQPPGCTPSGEGRCLWCSDFASDCDRLFFLDPWQAEERTVARRCRAAGGKCVADEEGTACAEVLRCTSASAGALVLRAPLPLHPQSPAASPPPLAAERRAGGGGGGAVAQLQRWWQLGKPSDDVAQAGVLVRQFDALSAADAARPWAACGEAEWCEKYNEIWPASIINQFHHTRLYRGSAEGGFVLAPPPLNRFFCAYAGDGNSMGHLGKEQYGCQRQCLLPKTWDCSFPPEQLQAALQAQLAKQSVASKHNEIVVDANYMRAHLPHSILAVFYMANTTKAQASRVHKAFIDAFHLSPATFPLLHLDLARGFDVAV